MIFLVFPIYSAEENVEMGIAFMSGGVSQKGREILNDRGEGYSLKLIFSNEKGEYLSNVPWLFIDLPNGT